MADKEKPGFKTSLQSLRDLAETDTKIEKIGEATSRYIALLTQYSTTIENAVGMYEKYNKALETHIQMGGKASEFNMAEASQIQGLLLVKKAYERQLILEGLSSDEASKAADKKLLAEKLATEATLENVKVLEKRKQLLQEVTKAQQEEAKQAQELKNALGGWGKILETMANPLIFIVKFLVEGLNETLKDKVESYKSGLTLRQLDAGIGSGSGGNISGYGDVLHRAKTNYNYDIGQASNAIENLIRTNALLSNKNTGYAEAGEDVFKATRAYGITLGESSKLMTEAYRYNTGDFKGILKDLAGVSSDTKMNMAETVTYFNRLNEATGKYASQQEFATQAIYAFSDGLQKGRIAVEDLNISMRGESMGKRLGAISMTAMSEEGREALRAGGIDPNASPIMQLAQMRKLEESKEGQKKLAEILRHDILNAFSTTGLGLEENMELAQSGAFSGMLGGKSNALFGKFSQDEMMSFLSGAMVGLDPKQRYKGESTKDHEERMARTEELAKLRYTAEYPEAATIKGIGDMLNQTMDNGVWKVKVEDSDWVAGAKKAAGLATPGAEKIVAMTRWALGG